MCKARRAGSVLVAASVASMVDQFNIPNIKLLAGMGYDVDVAANFLKGNTCPRGKIKGLVEQLQGLGANCYQVDFVRDAMDFKAHREAFRQLDAILGGRAEPASRPQFHRQAGGYRFLHCHSPIGGAISRIVAKKHGVPAIYTAHGFQFFKGAPAWDWLAFYPVEKGLSRWTDVLVTVNREDYRLARRQFHAKKAVYVPGVGVDTKKFAGCPASRVAIRAGLGIPQDAFVLLSVGELSKRKNYGVVVEALHRLKDSNIHYLLAGQGELGGAYRRMAQAYGQQGNIHMLGFREDIGALCKAADCFIHPSLREGFGIAPVEAMASGLALIVSDRNGIRDYAQEGRTGCCIDPGSVDDVTAAIRKMAGDRQFCRSCGSYNMQRAKRFDIARVNGIMEKVYQGMP